MVSRAMWFCESCVDSGRGDSRAKIVTPLDCEMCPLRGGALKRTLSGKWLHVQCFFGYRYLKWGQHRRSRGRLSDDLDSTKKKQKKFNPDMRAIYARSLFESQSTPFLQRRRERQFSALTLNGIVCSCLEAMDDDKFSSRCDESQTADDPLLVTKSASIATGNETDEAEALPRFRLLGAKIVFEPAQVGPRASEEQEEGNGAKTEDDELSTPSFNILGAVSAFSGAASTSAKESKYTRKEL
ncbi:hypothetical protein PsorP6_003054 [Peronosclerospora sorghi]|uniref:Uncharacterized protein n=1 Tax=Peronosclerospora sorghi TaxID=230839 RepID=A0ACC0VJ74_9STRA|nr:hypothetical protein PsorP6_003054 [Peronosclerospora sorghi]